MKYIYRFRKTESLKIISVPNKEQAIDAVLTENVVAVDKDGIIYFPTENNDEVTILHNGKLTTFRIKECLECGELIPTNTFDYCEVCWKELEAEDEV